VLRITYREEPCKSALNRVTGMPFSWSLNPYMGCSHRCAFCYVRAFERRADRPGDARYGTDVRVKTNLVAVLEAELSRRSWKREPVAIGAATDPYQPAESRYRLTRGAIQALAAHRTPFHLITRGPMILRDLDVLAAAAKRVRVRINVSIPTLDPRVVKVMEPGVAPGATRMRVVRTLVEAGLDVSVAMAPILPGLSDGRESMAAVVRAARVAGATRGWAGGLYLKPGTREHFLAALDAAWPELSARYARLYRRGAYLPREVTAPIQATLKELVRQHAIGDRRALRLEPVAPEEPGPVEQLGLGL
jgi:DNA repair photolyase